MLVFAGIALTGCEKENITGSGTVLTEDRAVTGFTEVVTRGAANVYITQGVDFNVQVKDYNNLLPHFETKLNGKALEVGFTPNTNVKNSRAEVFITMPTLEAVKTEGSGNITTNGIFGLVNLFKASIVGSGNINIENASALQFKTYIAGSGDIKAFGMIASEAATQTDGSGDVELTATSKLDVRIAGSGSVYYKGTPTVSVNISGSGQVVPR